MLLAADRASADDSTDSAVAFLRAGGDLLLTCAVEVVRLIGNAATFEPLARHCQERLSARLARPPRDPDDWSIDPPGTCACELCTKLAAFLTDPTLRTFDWPLAEPKRRHVHSRIDQHELPVRHVTRRQGRPYTLVLTKLPVLFERDTQERQVSETNLRWLTERLAT